MYKFAIILRILWHAEGIYGFNGQNDSNDSYWPDARIRYVIKQEINPLERLMIQNAMEEISQKTCVEFISVNTDVGWHTCTK